MLSIDKIKQKLSEAFLLDDKTFVSANQYDYKGSIREQLIIRHGGEAIKYELLNDSVVNITYTSHYFDKDGRQWLNLNQVAMKEQLINIYNLLPYKEDVRKGVFESIKETVKQHSPVTEDDKSVIWCANYKRWNDSNVSSFAVICREGIRVEITYDTCVKYIDYFDNKKSLTYANINKKSFDEFCTNEMFKRYVYNIVDIINNKERVKIEYKHKNSNNKICVEIKKENIDAFIKNLPSTVSYRVCDDDLKDIDFDIELDVDEEERE